MIEVWVRKKNLDNIRNAILFPRMLLDVFREKPEYEDAVKVKIIIVDTILSEDE